MTRVAWIGLGAMGARMARRLASAGHDLTVWNRTPDRADLLAGTRARVAATPAEAVRGVDAVLVMLADPAALREVTEGPAGVAAAVGPGTTVVDMSTVGPIAVARLLEVLPQGVTLLDAPVLGSLAEADAGTLTLLVGGTATAVAEMRPVLSLLGQLIHLGPTGAGASAKLVANFTLLGTVAMLGEALAMADGLGLQREVTWRVLAHTPLAAQASRRRPVVESGTFAPRFTLGQARKDADLIVVAAGAAGTDLPLARAAQAWLAGAEAAGLGALDYTAVLGHIPSVARHRSMAAASGGPERQRSASPAE
jgi:3-hydroxyisobutyrate dehydrogenase/2-hydroxy-3-oxopropionate reductase